MQQIKIFKSVDSELAEMEQEINRWLQESGARVLSMTGNIAAQPGAAAGTMNSFAASDVLVILLYENGQS